MDLNTQDADEPDEKIVDARHLFKGPGPRPCPDCSRFKAFLLFVIATIQEFLARD